MVTLDASVWLAAQSPTEPDHDRCTQLITTLFAHRTAIHQPGLFIVEVCATIARRTGDRTLALRAGLAALRIPRLQVHELTHRMAALAADTAARCKLRGADAVYVATARAHESTLLTLDRELRSRCETLARVRTPAEWTSELDT